MGIAILAGFVVIAVTIFTRATDSAGSFEGFHADVAVPAGDLLGVTVGGGQIILRYRLAGGGERLVVLDQEPGERTGTVNLVPAP